MKSAEGKSQTLGIASGEAEEKYIEKSEWLDQSHPGRENSVLGEGTLGSEV